jgi:hypothetical protein
LSHIRHAVRRALQLFAMVLALGASLFWLVGGARWGWSQTRVPVTFEDEVTGLQGIRYRESFVPGVDFLGGAWLGAGLLVAISAVCRRRPQSSIQS